MRNKRGRARSPAFSECERALKTAITYAFLHTHTHTPGLSLVALARNKRTRHARMHHEVPEAIRLTKRHRLDKNFQVVFLRACLYPSELLLVTA